MTLYSRGRKVAETSSVVYYIYREGFLFVFDGAWYKYYFLFYYTLLDQSKKKPVIDKMKVNTVESLNYEVAYFF